MADCSVLVASFDHRYRRLAGAALTRAGLEVHTMAVRPWRVERAIRLQAPDVLVLDTGDDQWDELGLRIADLTTRPGLVFVAEDPAAAGRPTIEKWGPLEDLIEEVERAARERSTPITPRLRLIPGGS